MVSSSLAINCDTQKVMILLVASCRHADPPRLLAFTFDPLARDVCVIFMSACARRLSLYLCFLQGSASYSSSLNAHLLPTRVLTWQHGHGITLNSSVTPFQRFAGLTSACALCVARQLSANLTEFLCKLRLCCDRPDACDCL